MEKMLILLVTCTYPHKNSVDSGTFVANWAQQLKDNDANVLVYKRDHITFGTYIKSFSRVLKYYRSPREYSYEWNGIQVYRQGIHLCLPLDFSKSSPAITYKKIRPVIFKIYAKFSFDLIYIATWGDLSLAISWVANDLKIPYVASAIGDHTTLYYNKPKSIYYKFERETYLGSKLVICVSEYVKDKVKTMTNGKANLITFYSGVDTVKFNFNKKVRINYRKRLNYSEDDFVVLFVGRLSERKGVYDLIKAFGSIDKNKYPVKLLMIGSIVEKKTILRAIRQINAEKLISVIDGVDHSEIPGYMNAADVLVLPSWMEGLPNVIMEACSCQLPVIATAVGGIPEIIDDKQTGILINPRSPEELAEKLIYLMKNKSIADEFGKKSRYKMIDEFNYHENGKIISQKLIEILKTTNH